MSTPLVPLYFCEPATVSLGPPRRRAPGPGRGVARLAPTLFVTEAFVDGPLARQPAEICRPDGNAFVFGPRFPLETYAEIASHWNDAGETGFLRLDKVADTREAARAQEAARDKATESKIM